MKRYSLLFLACFACAFSLSAQMSPTVARPKLVVGIVVDQMRWDYLYRYYNRYSEGGFRRLMSKGFNCEQTSINYLPSYTAPGHTCIYTGSVPSIHGIAANDWIDNYSGKKFYCVDDSASEEVNNGVRGGKSMSPRTLLTTTITDELRLATNFKSRVFGVAIKDRGSILPAGHLANGAFWLDDSEGNFVSSTYYANPNPEWLSNFNKQHLADSFIAAGWQLSSDINLYTQSLTDNNKYEGLFPGETAPVFPHLFTGLKGKARLNAFKATPGGNELTLQMARACRDGEKLGQGAATDFLCVSLSSTDYAGHQYGPNAIEMEDMYLRLDHQLADFLSYLDATMGAGNYLLFLTADHGSAHNVDFLTQNKIKGGLLSKNIKTGLADKMKVQFGNDSVIAGFINYQVYLNDAFIRKAGIDRERVKQSVMEFMNGRPELAYVVDMEHMERATLPDNIRTMVINGYNRGRSGVIEVIPQAGWYEGYGNTGTTHGTWNPYDAHIPLLWFGWHIPQGSTNTPVNMTDISATLAAMLHIQMPNGCIGKPISQLAK
ncbi:MAG: alkaline phosphatase family protein [Chitinophagia bacterium]|nr:alkaline phosphatase family protein [Chitinophagia bacterium]